MDSSHALTSGTPSAAGSVLVAMPAARASGANMYTLGVLGGSTRLPSMPL
eukprot:CAMPEP_0119113914 /NCGR_PEP_ID=MMETSP1180-20130426/45583_1 /TAXON_ID=3052 ORGANISM="Chlamydomonas cf sp, Strain CCMP681" /NCGR_SAMPLE_ID=MMETSP1180 /ASSEMBLY_ACC=CAM_ASM_000741 /LENGTH=49 /DNA_ID=CAMNT_0007102211 /DNA_START=76 /DNA_END=225 /DNA_ORIENTATION=+